MHVHEFEKSIANGAKSNPKAFYAYAKGKLKTNSGIADLEDGNKTAVSNEDKANNSEQLISAERKSRKHTSV